jgi:ATP-dependent Clp protease protease subunit
LEQIAIALPDLGKASEIPSPEEYDYWCLRERRIFYIDTYIDEDCKPLIELSKAIVKLNFEEMNIPKDKLKPIYLFLDTPGGDLTQSNYFCDLIKSSRIPIYTIAMGMAMSAGFLIFISGQKRFAFPHSQLLVHSGSAQLAGTAEQIEEAQKNYKKTLDDMKKYILENTEIDEKTFNKNRSKDWYLSADELVKYKVVDELITDISTLFQ